MVSTLHGENHDGLIDFSKYSTDQLNDLRYSIDRSSYPVNHRNLLAELERRIPFGGDEGAAADRWQVNFTRRTGLLGWFEGLGRRQQVYGDGWIEIGPSELMLHGWRRTWLGVPVQATIAVPAKAIRNVGQDGKLIRLEHGRRHRRCMFHTLSAEEAGQIVDRLPRTQITGFKEKWSQLRDFHRSLDAAGASTWITFAIVFVNIVAFLALTVQEKRASDFDLSQLLDWAPITGLSQSTANGGA
jgi:hypothetical protein